MSIFPMYPRKYGKSFKVTRRRPADIRFSENYNFPVQNYADYCGDMVIRAYRDLVIDEGVIVTPENPCKGLYIYCDGDCIINGTLSMTARGAKFDPSGVDVGCHPKGEAFCSIEVTYPYNIEQLEDYIRKYINSISEFGIPTMAWPSYLINNIYSIPLDEDDLATVPAVGANGGAEAYATGQYQYKPGNPGSNGTNRQSGGGGSGGMQSSTSYAMKSGAGAAGTAHGGGSGGGGNYRATTWYAGEPYCGKGGNGAGSGAGGGAGNPMGSGGSGGENGVGGLIILIVRGNLTIGTNGIVESKGSAGRNGAGNYPAGGGSGGGSINIFYGGSYTKNGQVLATGGPGGDAGTVYADGGKGGDGCVTEQQI